MIDPKLRGKVALITGANHGIGAATAALSKRVGSQGSCSMLEAVIEYLNR